jgi:murein DD-endopeptidase MepM/ murein hydrolase activator NlpD
MLRVAGLATGIAVALGGFAVAGAGVGASGPASLPSYDVPNAPGSITAPESISTPPAVPERRSHAELEALWRDAGAAYGVPWQVLGAINVVETNLGQNMGPSYAGAVGWMQFLPSTWDRWGMDGDGDGLADPWDPEDAIYSAARYLAAADAHTDLRRAVFAYNHSNAYVDKVMSLAARLGGGDFGALPAPAVSDPSGGIWQVDSLSERITQAERDLQKAAEALAVAEAELDVIRARRAGLVERAAAAASGTGAGDFAEIDAELTRLDALTDAAADRAGALRQAQRQANARLGRRLVELMGPPEVFPSSGTPVELYGQRPRIIGTPGAGTHAQSDWQSRNAIDIAAEPGTPALAVSAGQVVKVGGRDPHAGTLVTGTGKRVYGRSVTIATARGDYFYAHLADVSVAVGEAVRAGQQIGTVADWGSGPAHVHFGAETHDPSELLEASRPQPSVFEVDGEDVVAFNTEDPT